MLYQRLRKAGNSFVVTIPREEVERLNVKEGDLLSVEVRPVDIRPSLSPELKEILDATWQDDLPAYRYLAGLDGD